MKEPACAVALAWEAGNLQPDHNYAAVMVGIIAALSLITGIGYTAITHLYQRDIMQVKPLRAIFGYYTVARCGPCSTRLVWRDPPWLVVVKRWTKRAAALIPVRLTKLWRLLRAEVRKSQSQAQAGYHQGVRRGQGQKTRHL